jgi:hypothetical protein
MSMLTVLRPDIQATARAVVAMAVRPEQRSGLRLTLIENGKPKARDLLLAIADGLSEHLPNLSVDVHSKSSASWPISAEEAESLVASADLVLTGLGDCGGCSASSLADAVAVERVGLPATVVITEAFQGLVASYARRLGAPGYPALVLPHPISSRSHEEILILASKSIPTVLSLLTTS